MILWIPLVIIQCIAIGESLAIDILHGQTHQKPISNVIYSIIDEISQKTNECIVFILDPFYRQLIVEYNSSKHKFYPHYMIGLREYDVLNPPRRRIKAMLTHSKNSGCNAYVILITNGHQVIQFLQYTESKRLINTQSNFLLIHDERIFIPEMKYIWNRIINVIFIRQFDYIKKHNGENITREWFSLETVSYPFEGNGFVITHSIDTWYKGSFRNGNDHFANKINDLQKNKLRVAIFEHIPAVTKHSRTMYNDDQKYSDNALGIEFEIIKIISGKMNFYPLFYRPPNVEIDKWGIPDDNGSYNGLLGEVTQKKNAAFLLGDFYYTLRHYDLLELSYPYNTECLTFLTPESLTENSWQLLIIPFKLYTWIAVILIIFVAACILYLFALFYQKQTVPFIKDSTTQISNMTVALLKNTEQKHIINDQYYGLTLFTDIQNGLLYTYGMLLQVSLPRLPRAWALRLFIGWWWLYTILVTVAYRASMTATLANPVARVTIDTLSELAKSSITVGGWGEDKRELFTTSLDKDLNKIGDKFELYDNEDEASAKVANGTFGYYQSIYVLQEARAKRQLFEAEQKKKATANNENLIADRDLHIMQECVIHMPISIGMDRNSPLKHHVDPLVRKIVESGLVEKWLSDVMEWSKISEIKYDADVPKALMDLHKLYGGLVALAIGYFLGFMALAIENLYWKHIIMKNPAYDKYQMDIFYATMRQKGSIKKHNN